MRYLQMKFIKNGQVLLLESELNESVISKDNYLNYEYKNMKEIDNK